MVFLYLLHYFFHKCSRDVFPNYFYDFFLVPFFLLHPINLNSITTTSTLFHHLSEKTSSFISIVPSVDPSAVPSPSTSSKLSSLPAVSPSTEPTAATPDIPSMCTSDKPSSSFKIRLFCASYSSAKPLN